MAAETRWTRNPKTSTTWPSIGRGCRPCFKRPLSLHQLPGSKVAPTGSESPETFRSSHLHVHSTQLLGWVRIFCTSDKCLCITCMCPEARPGGFQAPQAGAIGLGILPVSGLASPSPPYCPPPNLALGSRVSHAVSARHCVHQGRTATQTKSPKDTLIHRRKCAEGKKVRPRPEDLQRWRVKKVSDICWGEAGGCLS